MSNTSISPTVAAIATTGVAGYFGPGIAPLAANMVALSGNAPSVSPVSAQQASISSGTALSVTWFGLQNGFIGTASTPRLYSHAEIQVTGTLGSGASIKIQGSNDGLTWADVSAAPITTATGLGFFATLNATPRYLRPNVTAGDGTTNLNVTAVLS